MGKGSYTDYAIPIKGLSIGVHKYSFSIDDKFFEDFENSQILSAEIDIDTELDRSETLINVLCHIKGSVTVECDRCLEDLVLPIDVEASLLVRFVKSVEDEDDLETITLDPAETTLDLKQFFYDYICLSLPLQRVHKEGECNPEMISRLQKAKSEEKKSNGDTSPFDKLKDLLN